MALSGFRRTAILLIIAINTCPLSSFNVDTKVPIVKEGRPDSYFGFSVAEHQKDHMNGAPPSFVVIVGAPRDNVTLRSVTQEIRDIPRPGQVWSCPVTSFQDDCEALDLVGHGYDPRTNDLKDQWLGVSVASQAITRGKAVACAHRFKTVAPKTAVYGHGLCIALENPLDMGDFLEPCYGHPEKTENQFGLCMSGTSVAVHKNGEIIIGTPRAYKGRGGIFKEKLVKDLGDESSFKSNPIKDNAKDKTIPEPTCRIDSYLGTASKIGKILPGGPTYVGGAPRSKDNGEVILFQDPDPDSEEHLETEDRRRLVGDQFGSGFGYTVEVVDFNGDGDDDLVVGAPFYHGPKTGGAIFIYLNAGGRESISSSTKPTIIYSRDMTSKECVDFNCENAQFGISLANLGDIDRDGFQDLAVGAPYEGSGCVYIFRGSVDGITKEYSQRICGGELISARPLKTFGYSLIGGTDMDQNGLPDLVVGAYDSSKILIMRSRPVIRIEALMQPMPTKIKPEVTQCSADGRNLNCFQVRSCFAFSVRPKKTIIRNLEIDYTIEAETFTGKSHSRIFFKEHKGHKDKHIIHRTISLESSDTSARCGKLELVYLLKTNKDFLNPIQFKLTYRLRRETTPIMTVGQPLPDINDYPVINQAEAHEELPVEFIKNCGPDDKCHSDLDLSANFELDRDEDDNALLKIGQVNELMLRVDIHNLGEDAHETTLTVQLPDPNSITFIQTNPRNIGCKPTDDRMEIICSNIGNPLRKAASKSFTIRMNPANVSPSTKYLTVKLRVNTTSEETDTSNDFQALKVRVVVETDMLVRGGSDPAEMFYGGEVRGESAIKYEDQIGNNVIHKYEVVNDGTGRVANSTLWISWPYEVENGFPQGKHLLYLMSEPEVTPPAVCYTEPYMVNPLKIEVNPEYVVSEEEKRKVPSRNIEVINIGQDGETEEVNDEPAQLKRRVKRDKVIQPETVEEQGRHIKVVTLDCDRQTAKCFKIRCSLGEVPAGKSVAITLRARLWNSTFLEDYRNVDHVRIYSKAEIEIDPALNVRQDTSNDIAKALLKAIPDISSVEQPGVQLWVYILAGCAGLVLLIVIILLLWKCGFFKRRTPGEMRRPATRQYKKKKYKSPSDDDYFS